MIRIWYLLEVSTEKMPCFETGAQL